MKEFRKNNAFTLIELVVVLIITSVVVATALVGYHGSVEKALEDHAKLKLMTLVSAMEMFHAKNAGYPNTGTGLNDIEDINSTLNTNLVEDPFDISCYGVLDGSGYCCGIYAHNGEGNAWRLAYKINDNCWPGQPSKKIYCSVGACPTCPASGC